MRSYPRDIPEPVLMNGLLICVARTAEPSGFATVSEPVLAASLFEGEPPVPHPVSASAPSASTAAPAIRWFLNLIVSPCRWTPGTERCISPSRRLGRPYQRRPRHRGRRQVTYLSVSH